MAGRRPNILFIVSDQERERSWLPPSVRLPWRERLLAEGVELANHWTHSAPCSPSRATMMTGRYLPGHLVYDNTVFPWHHSLDPAIPTIGSQLGRQGYRSSYIGKWHLTGGPTPPMDLYGYADWDGNDQHFMGWAGTGVHFDPVIADSAERWLDANGGPGGSVVPHRRAGEPPRRDVVPDGPARRTRRTTPTSWPPPRRCSRRPSGRTARRCPPFTLDYDDVVDGLPASFDDDLLDQAGVPPAVALGPAALACRLHPARRPGAVAPPARLLREAPRAGRRQPRQGARGPRAQRRVGRHRGRLHVGPRRHVRQPRAPLQGPVRLRRDHARALLHQAGRRDGRDRRHSQRVACHPTSTWPARSAGSPAPTPIPGCRASTSDR